MDTRAKKIFSWSIAALAGCLIVLSTQSVEAGPVTGTPGTAPYTRVGVYQGVVTIAPGGSGDNIMELGNNGRDIASTGNLYLRPGSVSAADAAVFSLSSGNTRLNIPGKVCLYGSGSADCRNVWPAGAGGGAFWNSAGGYLTPNNAAWGVQIGSAASPVTAGAGITVNNNSGFSTARFTNQSASGYAARFIGNVYVGAPVYAYQKVTVNGGQIYQPASGPGNGDGHEGVGSGLDADWLDGRNVTYIKGNNTTCSGGVLCLCFDFPLGTKCARMNPLP